MNHSDESKKDIVYTVHVASRRSLDLHASQASCRPTLSTSKAHDERSRGTTKAVKIKQESKRFDVASVPSSVRSHNSEG